MVSSVRLCDCDGVTTDRTGITLIDGVIPVFDVSAKLGSSTLHCYYNLINLENGVWVPRQFHVKSGGLIFVCLHS